MSDKKKGQDFSKTDIGVITFRDHHNAYTEKDENVTIERQKPGTGFFDNLLEGAYCFVMVHYFLWIFALVGVLIFFWAQGYILVSIGLVLLYIPSFCDQSQLYYGRPWHEFRTSELWHLAQRYGRMEVVREAILDPTRKYIFGLYPHGILILSRVCMYGGVFDKLFPGIETRVLGASPMFYIPGSREICLWMGAVDAAKKTAKRVLSKTGLSLMVYPGGTDEIFATDPNTPETKLILRTGFIRLALETGSDLVPSFVFGEKWCYNKRPVPKVIEKNFLRRLRVPLIIFWGKFFTWLPRNDGAANLSVVFGRPIPVERVLDPTPEQVTALHKKYLEAIVELYEKYKDRYGYPKAEYLTFEERDASKKKVITPAREYLKLGTN